MLEYQGASASFRPEKNRLYGVTLCVGNELRYTLESVLDLEARLPAESFTNPLAELISLSLKLGEAHDFIDGGGAVFDVGPATLHEGAHILTDRSLAN